jgi:hypothetical protein
VISTNLASKQHFDSRKGAAMSTNSQGNILSVTGRILLALAFAFTQSAAVAQNQKAGGKQDAGGKTQQSQVSPSPAAAPIAEPEEAGPAQSASSRETAPSHGRNEGIKVHGHWTIEVRNPDGTVATHREFENSLISGITGGATYLAQILGRQMTVGSWAIFLFDGNGNEIALDEPGAYNASVDGAYCTADPSQHSCSTNLTVTAANGSLTLAASGLAPSSFGPSVVLVNTIDNVCAATVTPQACPTTSIASYFGFTSRSLDGLNGDPPAVSVSPGQTVAVTVNITFS